jgi:hypothetical protein
MKENLEHHIEEEEGEMFKQGEAGVRLKRASPAWRVNEGAQRRAVESASAGCVKIQSRGTSQRRRSHVHVLRMR